MFIKLLYDANLASNIETLAQLRKHLVFKYVQKLKKLENALWLWVIIFFRKNKGAEEIPNSDNAFEYHVQRANLQVTWGATCFAALFHAEDKLELWPL